MTGPRVVWADAPPSSPAADQAAQVAFTPESATVFEAAARALAAELGRQAAREVFEQMTEDEEHP